MGLLKLLNLKIRSLKSPFGLLIFGISGPFAFAQGDIDGDGASALQEEIANIERQFGEQLIGLNSQLNSLNMDFRQCATEEARAKMQARADKRNQQTQAIAGNIPGAANTLGSFLGEAIGANNQVGRRAEVELKNIARESEGNPFISGGCSPKNNLDAMKCSLGVNEAAIARHCESQGYGARIGPNGTEVPYSDKEIKGGQQKCVVDTRNATRQEINSLMSRYEQAKVDRGSFADTAGRVLPSVMAAGVQGVGLGLNVHNSKKNFEDRNRFTEMDRKQCEERIKMNIDQTAAQIKRLADFKNQALLSAAARAAARDRNRGVGTDVPSNDDGSGSGGPGIPLGAQQKFGSNSKIPGAKDPAGGSGGGGAGGGGSGGGGGADTKGVPWTFGGGDGGPPGGGGLPAQPEGGTFADASTGGGGGGGGGGGFGFGGGFDSGFGMGGPGFGDGMQMGDMAPGDEGGMALGDGGLNVLIARARGRYMAYSVDLVRSLDLSALTESQNTAARAPASESQNRRSNTSGKSRTNGSSGRTSGKTDSKANKPGKPNGAQPLRAL